jgi:hypothetical protein
MENQSAGKRLGLLQALPERLATPQFRWSDTSVKSLRPPWGSSNSDFVYTIVPQIPEKAHSFQAR